MGTRSLVHFHDDDKILATVYRQFDGYPEGRGKELANFLAGITMRNGYSQGDAAGTHANGMGCLAAQWIAFEKEDIGNVYVYAAGATDCCEEYVYDVRETESGEIEVEVKSAYGDGEVYFKGTAAELEAFIIADTDSEEEVA